MYRDYYCGEPNEELIGKEIELSGWINKRRDHGGLLFIDLRDRTGLIQVVFDPENIKENEFHDHMFSIKDLEKVASNRTLKLINSND